MRYHSGVKACREHPNFFKVKLYCRTDTRLKAPARNSTLLTAESDSSPAMGTDYSLLIFNYELFNHNNINIRY